MVSLIPFYSYFTGLCVNSYTKRFWEKQNRKTNYGPKVGL
jgi:hypothetical protein